MFTILGIVMKLAGAFAGYATKRGDNATAERLEAIRADVEKAKAHAEVVKTAMGNPILSLIMGLFAFVAWVYFTAIVVDTIWQLPGTIDQLPAPTAAVMSTIIASLFFTRR